MSKSIDGLQRRDQKSKPKTVRRVVRNTTVRKAETAPVKETVVRKEAKARERAEDKAVREFFDEVKDSDPTNLLSTSEDLPAKKEKKAKNPKKKKSVGKIIRRIILVLVLLIIAGLAIVYFIANDFIKNITSDGSLVGLVFSDPDTPLLEDENGRTNVLIFGTEGYNMDDPDYDGGLLTDSMLVVSFDQDTGDAKAVSLPRDLKSHTCTATSKINELFYCKYIKNDGTEESKKKYENEGGEDLANAFEEVLGIDIQYRVHVNWAALIQAIDAIGGIDVVFTYGDQTWDGPETTIPTTDKRGLADGVRKNGKYPIQFPNGEVVHLDGANALAVARTRNAYGGYGASAGNFSREIFQQKIIEATVKKAKSSNITLDTVLKIKSAIGDNLRTNFKDTEIKTLIKLGNSMDIGSLESISLVSPSDGTRPLMTTGMINHISYVYPTAGVGNYSKIHEYIAKKLSNDFKSESAQLSILNGTSANGIASSAKAELEDEGFTVLETANAPESERDFDGVRIYQRNSGFSKTAAKLAEKYGVSIKDKVPEALKSFKGDFIVIIGNGSSKSDK